MADLIREKHAGMTVSLLVRDDNGEWVPIGGHGCTTDEEARAYAAEFTTPRWPMRAAPLSEVYPDLYPETSGRTE